MRALGFVRQPRQQPMDLINLELSTYSSVSSLSDALYVLPESDKSTTVSSKDIVYMTDSDGQSGVLEHEIMPLNSA